MAARRFGADRCPRRFGRYGVCDAKLAHDTDRHGNNVTYCPRCERMARGICCDCPRRVAGMVGRSRRCAECAHQERNAAGRRYDKRHPEHLARWRTEREQDPDRRQSDLEYKRAWRKANPEKVRAQKRREALRQSPHSAAYHAAYRAARKGQRSAVGLGHNCPCGRPLAGRCKKCDECKARERGDAETELAKRRGRGRRTDLETTTRRKP